MEPRHRGEPPPRHRKCRRHDLYDDTAECDEYCLNPARYYEELRNG